MKTLFTSFEIQNLIDKISKEIKSHYNSKDGEGIVALVILKGAVFFAADLLRSLEYPKCRIEFVRVSSYQGNSSSGKIKLHYPIECDLKNQRVLVIDEIIDTGTTAQYLKEFLQTHQPAEIKFSCLLDKKVCRKINFEADFVGKEIPDQFVIGYGLDFNENYRNLSEIKIYEEGSH